ncbi:MAG: hypothetical protein ACLQU5_36420 [Isosphaeraceae bacterium]
MDEMKKTDKLFLILHRAGWSIGDTAFELENIFAGELSVSSMV